MNTICNVTVSARRLIVPPMIREGQSTSGGRSANRLREMRSLRGLTQERLGELTGISQQQIGSLERGARRLTVEYARRLALHLNCAPSDLLDEGQGLSVPIVLAIAAAFSETRPDRFDLPPPHARVPGLPRMVPPDACFAAEIRDRSADQLYPPGSIIIVRRIEETPATLKIGAKIVVRHYITTRQDAKTMEVLVGFLDRSLTGDLLLNLRTSVREIAPAIMIQPAPMTRAMLAERTLQLLPAASEISYVPKADDPSEILGVVAVAITPE